MERNVLIPYVVERTASGERSYDLYSRLFDARITVCSENGITLADIIEFSGGKTESLMLPICWNGTDLINK